jgi:aquaporin Z
MIPMSPGTRDSLTQKARTAESEPQPVAAEAVGTFALVFFGVGSVVLAAEFIGAFGIALAFGFTLLALAYAIGPVSGCHVNPAVTLGMLLAGRIGKRTASAYWLAQLAGAIAGSAVLYVLARQVPDLHIHERFGTNGYDDRSAVDLSLGGAFLAEAVLTSLLVFVVLSVTHEVAVVGFDGLPIGITLGAVHLVGVPLTGTGVNPARSIGPALFAGGDALEQLWLFILAPLVGAALAVAVHLLVHPQPHPHLRQPTAPSGGEAA